MLKESEAIRVDADRVAKVSAAEHAEARTSEATTPASVRINTDGQAATFIRANVFPTSCHPDLLMLKSNLKPNNYDRKALLLFDARDVSASEVGRLLSSAELEPSKEVNVASFIPLHRHHTQRSKAQH